MSWEVHDYLLHVIEDFSKGREISSWIVVPPRVVILNDAELYDLDGGFH